MKENSKRRAGGQFAGAPGSANAVELIGAGICDACGEHVEQLMVMNQRGGRGVTAIAGLCSCQKCAGSSWPNVRDGHAMNDTPKPDEATNGVGSGKIVLLRESSAQAYVRSLNMQANANRNLARSHLYDNKRELAHYDLKVAEALEWASEEFRRLIASSERRQPQENT